MRLQDLKDDLERYHAPDDCVAILVVRRVMGLFQECPDCAKPVYAFVSASDTDLLPCSRCAGTGVESERLAQDAALIFGSYRDADADMAAAGKHMAEVLARYLFGEEKS